MTEQKAVPTDAFSAYEAGLRQLLEKLGRNHPRYSEALTYQHRLGENLSQARRYGDIGTRGAARAEIIDRLNELALAELGVSFNELCPALPARLYEPPTHPPLQRPPRATHFTGRQAELEQFLAQLQPGRVTTLCGPGGVGKTALAAQAVWTLAPENNPPERFPDGIIFHDFYTQPQAALALEAIARAYGEEPRPSAAGAAQRALSGRVALLILDGAENADDLDAVLAVRGQCGALITTRRHTDAPADWDDVDPLPNPQAVELLQAWGGDCAADEDAATRICTLIGALPLAVRLAGRYMAQRGEEAADYLAWLEETPLAALHFGQRQRDSVDVLLARSVDQVSDAARAALGVAGILALAPFDREAVAAALEAEAPTAGRALGELVDYGLLLRDEHKRYQAGHALVHTYARRRLAPPGEALGRLAAHYDGFAREQRELGLEGYARLNDERPHLMAVLETCVNREAWEAARSLAWAVEDYLDMQGHWTERVTLIEAGFKSAQALGRRYDEAAFLNFLGNAYSNLGQVERAIEQYEQALAISRESGDRRGEGNRLGNLGLAYRDLGQVERAIEYHEQSLAIAREIGDRRGEGADLGNLGLAYSDLGQVERAIEYHEQSLAISREIGDRRGEGADLGNLGNAYSDLGQVERAIEYHEQALAIAREIGDRRKEGIHLGNLGLAYSDLGQVERAIEYHEQSLAIAREIGDRRGEGADLGNLGLAYSALGQVERAIEYHEGALAIAREIGDRRGEGIRLGNLASVYITLGRPEQAVEYAEQGLRIAQDIGDPLGEAFGRWELGRAYRALGQAERSRDCLQQALAIFEEIKSPYAEQARSQLAELEQE